MYSMMSLIIVLEIYGRVGQTMNYTSLLIKASSEKVGQTNYNYWDTQLCIAALTTGTDGQRELTPFPGQRVAGEAHLRLRDRGLMAGEWRPSSSVMLSVLKCFVRKWSSSAVGWKGSWCSFSWDEHDDWVQKKIQKRNMLNACTGDS